ncbi:MULTISPECIES: 23S rRNA (pseudouridine(1915)-N(3))-methyltransferase RlmH [unclassified Granulicatella]|uniref:23S rRNA (pseudouridine(1915)-N(3))-methyltransferase RlmH n=1 Tax=unclassified Granulicatella TaxID=2630493 RepID=UPI001073097C|nr:MULTISPECIES: 23S rRNA (pseudouridine(1915)-N(3))-methyltransferase RlmH [unclassified Granulicatella]MBF0780062.1 23S rRNA (pseudouridine(1915)-N(3))-methyltransferase RlmH [Granulicatella sp. 19428wC4_WM01]TFU95848.1 23S rRNA (pseudouridine(1915)-N(3))-methyltransferase RlmH [Granulicatella sp. WM01]
MNIKIIAVGKLKEKYLKMGIDEYTKRLGAYCKFDIIEVSDEKTPENLSQKEMEIVKEKEAERILSKISDQEIVVILAIEGQLMSSEQIAQYVENCAVSGKSKLTFIIGGSLGLADCVKKRATISLSFGRITLPHQLMRLVLSEQIYRAFRIINNQAYHK